MKKILVLLAAAATMAACSDDNAEGIRMQGHDANKMMALMHGMMDEMAAMEMTHDPDIDFAAMMVMHHQGAIAMANLELQEGSDPQMKALAQAIIDAQEAEILQMQQIISGLGIDGMDMEFMQEQMEGMDKMDAMADQQLITGDIDNDFAALMIIHHQAAIDSASSYQHHGSDDGLLAMANDIVEMQTQEIIAFSNWLVNNRR